MSTTISVTKVNESKISNLDFNDIPFGKTFTDHMFTADYDGEKWTNFQIIPLEPFAVHPANLAWHYGQAIFEGMKATKMVDGTPVFFRPEMHIQRLNFSARRMCMPEFPADVFHKAIHGLVTLDQAWIPTEKGSALYIRPLMIASDEYIGVRESKEYKLIIFCLPVGPYYNKPVSLLAEETYIRAAQGGVGAAKTAGNYAAALYPDRLAKEKGYDQIMWLDAKEFKYIQEVGTMNIFFVMEDKVITPATTGTILKGITRDTIIRLLRDKGVHVEERQISVDELVRAYEENYLVEVFGSGTAAVVANVDRIGIHGKDYHFEPSRWTLSLDIKNEINSLREGSIEDKHNWLVPAKSEVLVQG